MSDDVIVFGDDGSEHADQAWRWIGHQRWPGWSVEAVTALRSSRTRGRHTEPVSFEEWTPEHIREPSAESLLVGVRHLRADTDPRSALEACSHAALMVVGPRGVKGRKGLRIGSTANHLMRHPPAPLVIASHPDPVTRVLFCADGSATSTNAAEEFTALPLAEQMEAAMVMGVATVGMYDDSATIQAGVGEAAAKLEAFNPEQLTVESGGDIAGEILERALAWRAHLLVMGTRGLSGIQRVTMAATAFAIASASPCSVLVVPGAPD